MTSSVSCRLPLRLSDNAVIPSNQSGPLAPDGRARTLLMVVEGLLTGEPLLDHPDHGIIRALDDVETDAAWLLPGEPNMLRQAFQNQATFGF